MSLEIALFRHPGHDDFLFFESSAMRCKSACLVDCFLRSNIINTIVSPTEKIANNMTLKIVLLLLKYWEAHFRKRKSS